MTLLETLNRRYATKKFDPSRNISEESLEVLLKVIQLAPTSYGLQPLKVIVITDENMKKTLREASWDQAQISDCSHLILFAIVKDLPPQFIQEYIDIISSTRNIPKERLQSYQEQMMTSLTESSDPQKLNIRAKNQVYIALGFLLFAAAEMHIDACPMEGFDTQKYNKLLDLDSQGLSAAVVCTLGYRAKDDVNATFKKVRRPLEKLVIRK